LVRPKSSGFGEHYVRCGEGPDRLVDTTRGCGTEGRALSREKRHNLGVDNGWQSSANAWIADMGERGDFGRRYVLDPVMVPLALARSPKTALDVGCGEGRFCRTLRAEGVEVVGIDPTPALITAARRHDTDSDYLRAVAEHLPFRDAAFDLVVSYLSLIDIPDMVSAIAEMSRVLKPGGSLLIANLTSFNSACADEGWIKDRNGRRLHYPIDHYLEERAMWIAYRGIRIVNHHRPLSAYMRALLGAGLVMTHFDEPEPTVDAPSSRAEGYGRVPWFLVMEWLKPRR
jgi:SAM-dependent methyltransferase